MLLDLVSPWAAAVETRDPAPRRAFTARHANLLHILHLQRSASDGTVQPTDDPQLLRAALTHVSARALQRIEQLTERVAQLGADAACDVALLVGDARGGSLEVMPWEAPPLVAVFVEDAGGGTSGVRRLHVAVARGLALATRWGSPLSVSPLARRGRMWDRWQLARDVPLSEWLYSDGIASHVACAANPDIEPHMALGLTRAQMVFLREHERTLRKHLAADLGAAGVGGILRWLQPGADRRPRMVSGEMMPAGAGRYLGWRMTATRVRTIGLASALRAAS